MARTPHEAVIHALQKMQDEAISQAEERVKRALFLKNLGHETSMLDWSARENEKFAGEVLAAIRVLKEAK